MYCILPVLPEAGAVPTEMGVDSEQPGIQQAPHTHKGLLPHPALIAAVPVSKVNIQYTEYSLLLQLQSQRALQVNNNNK